MHHFLVPRFSFLLILTAFVPENGAVVDHKEARLAILSKFVGDNRQMLQKSDGSDERWLFKFMNSNSLLAPQPPVLSDAASPNLVLADAVGTAKCASGWTRWSGNGCCYKEMTPMATFYAAEDWCWNQRAGAHLASVHSQAEAVWLNYQYKVWYSPMSDWIGLRRNCDNTDWIWTDGTPVDFLWWQPGYPLFTEIENSCTTLWDSTLLRSLYGFVPGMMDDGRPCSTQSNWALCKYDPNTSIIGTKWTPPVCTTTTTSTSTTTTTTPTTTTTTPTTTTTTPTTTTTTTPTTTTTTPTTTTTTPTTTTTEPTTTTTVTTTTTTPTTTTTTPTTTTTVTTTTEPTTTTTTPTTTTTTPTTTTTEPTTTTTTPTTTTTTPTTTTTTPTTTTTTPTTTTTTPTTTTTTPTTTTPTTTTTTPTTTTTTPTTTTTTPTTTTTTPTTTTTTPTTTTTIPTTTTTTPTTTRTTTLLTTTKPFDTSKCPVRCPTDWVYYSNLCYGLLTASDAGAGYSEFSVECQKRGGTIVYINDWPTNEFLRLSFSTNNVEGFDEAWIATQSQNFVAPGGALSGGCNTMALSQDKSGEYVARGYWRQYPCARLLKFGICQKGV